MNGKDLEEGTQVLFKVTARHLDRLKKATKSYVQPPCGSHSNQTSLIKAKVLLLNSLVR